MNNIKPKRVVAYLRKSSEDNEKGVANKQLNSINYQKKFVEEQEKKYDLKVVKTFQDDKTGYTAFIREGFGEMLDYLKEHKGEIDGILCTEVSRLARNFGDGGLILWYLQSGVIKSIYTDSKIFTDSSTDQLMVAIEFALSKKSSDDTGYRTVQGMRAKAHTMKHPSRPAVLGYKTEGPPGGKKWVIDSKIGPLIKQVFEQFSTGQYTFDQIADYAYQIGIRSRSSRSKTGKISKNSWRDRLSDIQYTGVFFHEGEEIAGEYEPIVDVQLYYKVQDVMSGNQHPKTRHISYAYTGGMIKCGLCGGYLSGTHRKGITYYRCGKRKKPCKDINPWPYIPEPILEEELIKELEKIEIDDKTWRAAKEYVIELNQPQLIDLKKQIRILSEKISFEEQTQVNIGTRFVNGEISKSESNTLKKHSEQREANYRKTLIKCENITHELEQLMNEFLDNVKFVTKRLRIALPENKKEFVDIFCENLVWKDEKLRWDWKKPYYFLAKRHKKSMVLPD